MEVRDMKGKCPLFAMLFSMLIMVAPALAEPAQKIPVTVETFGGTNVPSETRETNGGIIHQEAIRAGNVRLTIDGQAPIIGTYSEFVHITINTKTGEVMIQNSDVLTFPGGSFEGIKQTRQETAGPTTVLAVEQHAVLQGSGAFNGQILMISMDWVQGDPLPRLYSGFLLIP